MTLRKLSSGPNFYAGTRTIQSELFAFIPPALSASEFAVLLDQVRIRIGTLNEKQLEFVNQAEMFFELVSVAHSALLREANLFYPESAELLNWETVENGFKIAIPRVHLHNRLSSNIFQDITNQFYGIAKNLSSIEHAISKIKEKIDVIIRHGPNIYQFLRAAHNLEFPIIEWPSAHLQIGHAKNAAILNGSITHNTPGIGIQFARNKLACKALLSQAGFPVAKGALTMDLASARNLASIIGFPVAVKPADLDGGIGVTSDIQNNKELDLAYETASSASQRVLIEQHIPGKDYRLLIHNEELLIAVERTPGGVIGNGIDSIMVLLDKFNSEEGRGQGPDTHRYTIEFDAEASLMLARSGLNQESVPANGQFVALRRAANFALGGSVRLVDEGEIHPDNLELAIRSMRLLRLDLAGLDLILPDIGLSWHEAGGAICEINAQPFVGGPSGTDFHDVILRRIVPNGGRIPIVLVLGSLENSSLDALNSKVSKLAVVDASGSRLIGRPLSCVDMPWQQSCQAALHDSTISACVVILDPDEADLDHSPTDRFSAAYLLDTCKVAGPAQISPAAAALLKRAMGPVAGPSRHAEAVTRAGLSHRSVEIDCLLDDLVAAISTPFSSD